jgi:UDP-glucose 4-epimerase
MNVLLTGGLGYIGSHIVVELIDAGYQPVIYDNLTNSHLSVLSNLTKITNQNIPFIQGDVRDKGQLKSALSEYAIDVVIHLAGLKAVSDSLKSPLEYYDNNVLGTVTLLQTLSACQINKLVFSSSATVYGEPKYLPLDELHPIAPQNPYGRSKAQVEEILHDVSCANSVWDIVALRYFNPIGAHTSGLLGESPRDVPANLMPHILNAGLNESDVIKIFGDKYNTPDGTCIRDFIHVVDLAKGHVAAVSSLGQTSVGFSAYNLGTGRGTSVKNLIETFEVEVGISLNQSIEPRRDGDSAVSYACPKKAEDALGWRAELSIKQMIESAWLFAQNKKK